MFEESRFQYCLLSRAGVDAPLGFVLSFFHIFVLIDLQSHLRSVKNSDLCLVRVWLMLSVERGMEIPVDLYKNMYADHLHISDRITEGVFGQMDPVPLLTVEEGMISPILQLHQLCWQLRTRREPRRSSIRCLADCPDAAALAGLITR
jgi:hypothetical protein